MTNHTWADSWADRQTAIYCFRVWFRFADDDPGTERATLVDAKDSSDAIQQVHKTYDGIQRIIRTEKLD